MVYAISCKYKVKDLSEETVKEIDAQLVPGNNADDCFKRFVEEHIKAGVGAFIDIPYEIVELRMKKV